MQWYEEKFDGTQSIIAAFQLYSDESKTSLKLSGLAFYPLYVNDMNVYKSMQDFMSNHRHSILAYLPVQLFYLKHGN